MARTKQSARKNNKKRPNTSISTGEESTADVVPIQPWDIHSTASRYFDINQCNAVYEIAKIGSDDAEWEYCARVVINGRSYVGSGGDKRQKGAKKAALRSLLMSIFPECSEDVALAACIQKHLDAAKTDPAIKSCLALFIKNINKYTCGSAEEPTYTFNYEHDGYVQCDAVAIVQGQQYKGIGEPHAYAKCAKSLAMLQLLRELFPRCNTIADIMAAITKIEEVKVYPFPSSSFEADLITEHRKKKHKKDTSTNDTSIFNESKTDERKRLIDDKGSGGGTVIVEFITPKPGEAYALTLFAVKANQDAYNSMKCSLEEACRVLAVEEEQIKYGQVEKMIDTDNEALIGFYSLKNIRESDKSMELGHVFVDQRYARQGMGTKLFRRAAESAYYRGASRLHFISDPNAVGFYSKLGATVVGHEKNMLDPSLDVAWMEYNIDSKDIYF